MKIKKIDKERYARQLMLPEIGLEGQQKLQDSRVIVVGAGGLGSPVLSYLAAAGIGHISLVDDDTVSASNLQRQILYETADLGKAKAEQARRRLSALNPSVEIIAYEQRLSEQNVESILSGHDIVIDATDNFFTRKLMDQYCAATQTPYIYGSVSGFTGQLSVFNTRGAGRLLDLFPDLVDAQADDTPVGVLGAVAGVIGSLQACEAVKLLLNIGEPLVTSFLTINLLDHQYMIYEL